MSERVRTLREDLARYIDNEAFVARRVGKERAEHLANRRRHALKRATAAVRFFLKPENRARLEEAAARHSGKGEP